MAGGEGFGRIIGQGVRKMKAIMVHRLFQHGDRRSAAPEDLVKMSEAVYNFQRIFNLKMSFGRREHDDLPYRAVGPVTELEYESRAERYDKQLLAHPPKPDLNFQFHRKKLILTIKPASAVRKVTVCVNGCFNRLC